MDRSIDLSIFLSIGPSTCRPIDVSVYPMCLCVSSCKCTYIHAYVRPYVRAYRQTDGLADIAMPFYELITCVMPPPPPFSFADEVEWYLKLARPGLKTFEEVSHKI